MRYRLGLVLLTAASVACSERTLSPDRAASLISDLEQFQREAQFTINTGVPFRSVSRCLSQAEVERTPLNQFALESGWVRFETREATIGLRRTELCPAMALTPAGEAASVEWTRARAGLREGTAWVVPIGRREMLRVTDLTTTPDGAAQVEFDWRWAPNQTGTALRKSIAKANVLFDQVRKGRASCRRLDDGWQCRLGMWATPADALGDLAP
jgi:hypothetical protein